MQLAMWFLIAGLVIVGSVLASGMVGPRVDREE
jgi:hypothetical protein